MTRDLLTAITLVIVIEGMVYALFPNMAKRMAEEVQAAPENLLRILGLSAMALGVFLVWIIRG